MSKLTFTIEVEATSDNIQYIKHLIKGSLRRLDENAKVFHMPTQDLRWFESVEKDQVLCGNLEL